jgi:cathepsin B
MGEHVGGHSVKVVGWGVDELKKYWIVANSFNGDWGEDGFIRVARGHNECNIEVGVVAGIPKIVQ